MTRKYWKVNLTRACLVTHVLAVINGIVEAVYIPQTWKLTENETYKGRCELVGMEDINSEYIGKSVVGLYGKSQNPVKYINV